MGYYINPRDCTKEEWLAKYGTRYTSSVKAHTTKDGNADVLVCLVDNGPFTAAGIAYSDDERDAFAAPDGRPKLWYLVNRELLVQHGFLRGGG
jgi:hypothetical protein